MYLSVLNQLLRGQSEKQKKRLIHELREVIGTIVILRSSLSVKGLSGLTGLSENLIHIRLNPLQSLLNVPDDNTSPVQRFHLSFCGFLLDPENCKMNPFWVDEKDMHRKLTTRCLLICKGLKKNLCRLQSYGTRRTEIDSQTVSCCFPPDLQYSCRYWPSSGAEQGVRCFDARCLRSPPEAFTALDGSNEHTRACLRNFEHHWPITVSQRGEISASHHWKSH